MKSYANLLTKPAFILRYHVQRVMVFSSSGTCQRNNESSGKGSPRIEPTASYSRAGHVIVTFSLAHVSCRFLCFILRALIVDWRKLRLYLGMHGEVQKRIWLKELDCFNFGEVFKGLKDTE